MALTCVQPGELYGQAVVQAKQAKWVVGRSWSQTGLFDTKSSVWPES